MSSPLAGTKGVDYVDLIRRAVRSRSKELGARLGDLFKFQIKDSRKFARGRNTATWLRIDVVGKVSVKNVEGVGFAHRMDPDEPNSLAGESLSFRRAFSDALNNVTQDDVTRAMEGKF